MRLRKLGIGQSEELPQALGYKEVPCSLVPSLGVVLGQEDNVRTSSRA